MAQGRLRVEVFDTSVAMPVAGAGVIIEDPATGNRVQQTTDESGQTQEIILEAPDESIGQTPNGDTLPYKVYNVYVSAQGFQDAQIEGVQIYGSISSYLPVVLERAIGREVETNTVVIPQPAVQDNTQRTSEGGSGNQRIFTRVFIPSSITVHLGSPSSSARNVRVSFIDYIKNVASSEIYPTWPDVALRANIYAQIGFALNRVFTEWYPSRGYNFNITNSTAYDQSFVYGRNIFDNISRIVDEIFNVYPRRRGDIEPLFTQYCNGTTVTCEGLSQWGTVTLANRGYLPYSIIQYYYGYDVDLVRTEDIRDIEGSYPGYALRRGESSNFVRIMQLQLNRIRRNYPAIPAISSATGFFGSETEAAVRAFQRIFNLSVDGIVGKATWYKIQYLYAAVKQLAELDSEGQSPEIGVVPYPGRVLRTGSRGSSVVLLQQYLNDLSNVYPQIPSLTPDGVFGNRTRNAVLAFQRLFGLTADGLVGENTWNKLTLIWSNSF